MTHQDRKTPAPRTPECPDLGTLQDFLEGLLPEAQMSSLRTHIGGCKHCTVERVRFERLFEAFEAMPLEAPTLALTERVLDRVLPARRQARWVRRLGVGYAAALVASLVGVGAMATLPAGRSFMAWLASEAPARVVDLLRFSVQAVSFVALRLAGGWGLVSGAGSRVSPLVRALMAGLDQPVVQVSFALSAVSCMAVVWWLHSRKDRSDRGMPHVGLLGF